jgi:hypothetical protein
VRLCETKSYFRSNVETITEATNISAMNIYEGLIEEIETHQNAGSGWVFHEVIHLDIHIDKYEPIKGNSYIPLPGNLVSKKAIINMENNDNECFKWSVTASVYPRARDMERIKG